MASLRYDLNKNGLIMPDPKGKYVLYEAWEKCHDNYRDLAQENSRLKAQNEQLKIDVLVAAAGAS